MISEAWFNAKMVRAAALPSLEEMLAPQPDDTSDNSPTVDTTPALKAMFHSMAKGNVVIKKPNGTAHG